MLNPLRKLVFAASLGAGIALFASVASAPPVLDALAIRNAAPPTIVEEVQWRGRWGWGWGAPVAAGVVAGANVLVGGSARTVALQPLSLEGSIALNIALGVSMLKLRAV